MALQPDTPRPFFSFHVYSETNTSVHTFKIKMLFEIEGMPCGIHIWVDSMEGHRTEVHAFVSSTAPLFLSSPIPYRNSNYPVALMPPTGVSANALASYLFFSTDWL